MKLSKPAREKLKTLEGFRGTAYLCPAGVWTLGLLRNVQLLFCSYVCCMRQLWCFKCPKVDLPVARLYSRLPPLFQSGYPEKGGGVLASALTHVLIVFGVRNVPKILKSIVGSHSVNVIDHINRPMPVRVEPSKSVPEESHVKKCYLNISLTSDASSLGANNNFPAMFFNPSEVARVRVVAKHAFEDFLGKGRIIFSHAVSPVKKWFGQRPQSVSALLGPRHFSTEGFLSCA